MSSFDPIPRRLRRLATRPGPLAALTVLSLLTSAATARGQGNFQPLERGDYEEREETVAVLEGLQVGGEYAIRQQKLTSDDLRGEERDTQIHQDIRLRLSTIVHRDISVNMVLEPAQQDLSDGNIRRRSEQERSRLPESQPTNIGAREAYLLYNFNPNSGLFLGKTELHLGDRRGKVFHGIVPGMTFDCELGTWCMPFGGFKIGDEGEDWVYHLALKYTGWDTREQELREAFEVEVFRFWYTEKNVPLGRNLGPGFFPVDFDENNPSGGGLLTTDDAGNPIFYDAHGYDYYGLRLNWEAGPFWLYTDVVAHQGSRIYHRYRRPDTGIDGLMQFNNREDIRRQREKVRGFAVESEIGYRWGTGQVGLRFLHATGDPRRPTNDGQNYLRGLDGYYELTPGTYRGTRLYFNGAGGDVAQGAGLGHSINNTRMIGAFYEFANPPQEELGYATGIYHLEHNNDVLDTTGRKVSYIGLEWDNMVSWYVHKAATVQFELNFLQQGPAFSPDDFTAPNRQRDLLTQALARFVYRF